MPASFLIIRWWSRVPKLGDHLCAGSRNILAAGVAAGHRRPASLFDEGSALERSDVIQFAQPTVRVGLLLELGDADRCEGGDHGRIRAIISHLLSGATGHPSTPAKANDRQRHGATNRAHENGLCLFNAYHEDVLSVRHKKCVPAHQEKQYHNIFSSYVLIFIIAKFLFNADLKIFGCHVFILVFHKK
jgi:hypothetical protein